MTMLQSLAQVSVLLAYVALSIAGLTIVKSSGFGFSLPCLMGLMLYGLGFVVWMAVILKAMPLSVAFPLASGALLIGSQLSGWLFLDEELTALKLAGVAMILGGLGLVQCAGMK
jgi:multidrug transporter EmrE-like cation transporter